MRAILRASGQVFLTIGVVIALFIGYLFWGSGVRADQAQRQFAAALEHAWQAPDGLGGRPTWVLPTDLAVLDRVPGRPGATPARRLITLITCDRAWTGTQRVIVTGVLTAVSPRTGGHA